MKKIACVLLVAVLALCFTSTAAWAADSTEDDFAASATGKSSIYLAFTSDVHNNSSNSSANRLAKWLENVSKSLGNSVVFDNMGFCGDSSDAGYYGDSYWSNVQAVMNVVSNSSYVKGDGVFTAGNHEWSNGQYGTTTNSVKSKIVVGKEGAKSSGNYLIYCMGATSGEGTNYTYSKEAISDLDSYLRDTASEKAPVFILSHHPLHDFSGSYFGSRKTTNSQAVIDVLNKYAVNGREIVFLWGHNHTLTDSHYNKVYTGSLDGTAINFYYAAAGCMSNNGNISGKGLVARIEGHTIESLTYYDESYHAVGTGYVKAPSQSKSATQLAGDDRYETACEIACEAYPEGADGVIVASGEDFPDALSASALAGLLDYPIVLTRSKSLDSTVAAAIVRLDPDDIIIVGGPKAISEDVEDALDKYGDAHRIYGSDRYATADAIFDYGCQFGWSDECIVATGADYPDALSISSYAFANKTPIFLSNPKSGLTADTKACIYDAHFDLAVVVGGKMAVPTSVKSWLNGTCKNVCRLSGDNRYETSLKIAKFTVDDSGTADGACIVTGMGFPDALAGCTLAGSEGAPILLADEGHLETLEVLEDNRSDIECIYFLGGDKAVTEVVQDAAKKAIGMDLLYPSMQE